MPFAQLAQGLVEHPLADGDDGAVLLGQRDEQVWRDKTVLRVLPANQRLDADHAVVGVVDLRLEHQVHLVAVEGLAQLLLQLAAATHLAVDAGDVELVAVARAALGQGHGLFGFLQQLLGAVAVFREQGDADGGAQAHFLLLQGEGRFEAVEDALRQLGGFVGLLDVGLDQGELVAAEAGQGAEAAAVAAQTVGQGQQ